MLLTFEGQRCQAVASFSPPSFYLLDRVSLLLRTVLIRRRARRPSFFSTRRLWPLLKQLDLVPPALVLIVGLTSSRNSFVLWTQISRDALMRLHQDASIYKPREGVLSERSPLENLEVGWTNVLKVSARHLRSELDGVGRHQQILQGPEGSSNCRVPLSRPLSCFRACCLEISDGGSVAEGDLLE